MQHRTFAPPLLVSLSLLVLSFGQSAFAADMYDWAQTKITENLVNRLSSKQHFFRGVNPPKERRVRISRTPASTDTTGQSYLHFAIDERRTESWTNNEIVGCIYLKTGDIYIQRASTFYPSGFLLGEKVEPVQNACWGTGAPPGRAGD